MSLDFRFISGWIELGRPYLRLGEVDKATLLLGEVLRGPFLVLVDTLVFIHLNLIGAAEIIATTRRDVWHGSLENTTQRHHRPLHWITAITKDTYERVIRAKRSEKHCCRKPESVFNPHETRSELSLSLS